MTHLGLDRTLAALADPTRRKVIELLGSGPRSAGELALELQISAAALSRHLRILRDSGLVAPATVEHDARIRLYRLEGAALHGLRDWVGGIEGFWRGQLEAFQIHIESGTTAARPGANRAASLAGPDPIQAKAAAARGASKGPGPPRETQSLPRGRRR